MEIQKDVSVKETLNPLEHLCLKPALISVLQSNNYFAIKDLENTETDYGAFQPCIIKESIIVPLLNGKDICVQAGLTTDRVYPVIIPAIQLVDENIKESQVLILTRTRELCQQIVHMITELSKEMNIKVQEITGGVQHEVIQKMLQEKPQILVGTPGRIYDLTQRDRLKLGGLKLLILDEADELLGRGFQDQITQILKFVPMDIQMGIFSTCFSHGVDRLVEDCLREPVRINLSEKYVDMKDVEHFKVFVQEEKEKNEFLIRLYNTMENRQSVIYHRRPETGKELVKVLKENGFSAVMIVKFERYY